MIKSHLSFLPVAKVISEFIATSCPATTPTHAITIIRAIIISAALPTVIFARSGSVAAPVALTFFEIKKD